MVETDGESSMLTDGLTLISEFWREIGVKLFVKPQDRTVLRNRAYSGAAVMVAAQGLDLAMPTAEMSPDELARSTRTPMPGRNGASTSRPRARRASPATSPPRRC